jgi:phosphatidylethanolamine/phosphatidyl-N-methylethanolamine N-methyltransferase
MGDVQSHKSASLNRATEAVKRRYNRMAPLFDLMERRDGGSRFRQWRALLWSKVEGSNVLEVGVGTGANFPYYPADIQVTAIDFSANMLKLARKKVSREDAEVILEEMDVQDLRFAENTFDTVVASLVFCSVPDPVRGLIEIKRVCKPNGKVVLLEHVVSSRRLLGFLMNLLNPVILWMVGDNINRKTVENVVKSGLAIEKVTDLGGVFRLIEARKNRLQPSDLSSEGDL